MRASRLRSAWRRVAARRTRYVLSVAAGLAAALLSIVAALAFFAFTSDASQSAVAVGDSLPAGATPTAPTTNAPNGNAVKVTFNQATTVSGNVAITSYHLKRYPAAGGSAVAAPAACSVAAGMMTCTENSVPDGRWRYTDTPAFGANWVGIESGESPAVLVDTTGPTVTATVIGQTSGATINGYVKSGTGYFVYANVTDAGAGVQSVTANVASVTSGQTSVTLTAGGPFTPPGGGTYTYRSAQLTSNAGQADGAVTYTVNATDAVGNTSANSNNGAVTFDSTAPVNHLSLSGQTGGGSFVSGTTVYYRGSVAGSFTITNALSDAGAGPAASTFAPLQGTLTGWTHTGSTVTTPSGGPYVSTAFAWTAGTTSSPTELITGLDAVSNGNTGTQLTFVNDSTAPSVTATVIGQSSNASVSGYVQKGAGYFVYANATDSASGVASVTANVGGVTTGQTAVTLSSAGGPFTAPGGASYAYRSAQLTSNASQSDGAVSYTVNATDAVGNTSANANNGSVIFDSTAPGVTATVVGQASGATVNGFVQKNAGYYVYASVTDAGAGVRSVTANMSTVTTGQSSVSLTTTGGPFTAPGGGSYAYRSALLTSNSAQPDGLVNYIVNATDNVGNASNNFSNGTVTFDSSAPAVVLTFPGAGPYAIGNSGSTSWNSKSESACSSSSAEMCGTSSDGTGSGVASLQISVLAPTGKYWDGSFTGGVANFTATTETFVTVTGTAAWTQAWSNATFGGTTGSYTLHVRATDGVGNVSAVRADSFSTN